MIKKKILLTVIFIIFILPIKAKAECSYSEVSRLKKNANNLTISYDSTTNNNIKFDITTTNFNKDIYILDVFNLEKYYYTNNNELVITNYEPGAKIIYKIYSNKNNCKNLELLTQYINLPFYNKYYNDEICNGIEEYSLCQKWTTHNITNYEDFINKVKLYKENLKNNEDIIVEDTKINQKNLVIEFIFKNYIYIILATLLIVSFVAYRKQSKRSFNV